MQPQIPWSPELLHDITLDFHVFSSTLSFEHFSHFFVIPLRWCKVTLKQQNCAAVASRNLLTLLMELQRFKFLRQNKQKSQKWCWSQGPTHQNQAAIMYRESKPFTFLARWTIWMGWMGWVDWIVGLCMVWSTSNLETYFIFRSSIFIATSYQQWTI